MEIKEFIEKFAEANEIEVVDQITPETEFRTLDGWSSLSVMITIAFFDEECGKEISGADIKNATTIQDLFNLATA